MKKSSFIWLSLFFCCLSSKAFASEDPRARLKLGGISSSYGSLQCSRKFPPEGGFTHIATTKLNTGNPLVSIISKNYRVWADSLDIHFVVGPNFSGPSHFDRWEVQSPSVMYIAGNVRTLIGRKPIFEVGSLDIPKVVCPKPLPPFVPASLPPPDSPSDPPQAYPCANPGYRYPFPTCSPGSVARYSKRKLVVEGLTGEP